MANGSEFKTCLACTKPLFEGPLDGYCQVFGQKVPFKCFTKTFQCFWKLFSGWKVIEFALWEDLMN